MAKKDKPLKVLMIDDETKPVKTVQIEANNYRIILEHAKTRKDALTILEDRGELAFAGIIVDARGLVDENQELPDEGGLLETIVGLRKLAPTLEKANSIVILTGYSDVAENVQRLMKGTEVYSKGNSDDINKMLQHFIEKSKDIPHLRIMVQYPDVFEVFEKQYLDREAKEDLIACLEGMDNSGTSQIKDNLNRLRRLIESVLIELCRIDRALDPKGAMAYENKVQSRGIMTVLKRQKYVESEKIIDKLLDTTYSIGSDFGSHNEPMKTNYPPTKYTVQMATYALMDILLWFKGVMDERGH